MRVILFFFLLFVNSFYFCCKADVPHNNRIVACNDMLIQVIMEDIFNPPIASRVHVYPNIAAYCVLQYANTDSQKQFPHLQKIITHLPTLNFPSQKIIPEIAAEFAFTTTAKKIVFSEYMITQFENEEKKYWSQYYTDTTEINNAINYGRQIAKQLFGWIDQDNYIHTRTLQRYVLADSQGAWKPTAPEYTNALEPNWMLLRPLVCKKNNQFKAAPNVKYAENKNSNYYKQALKLYNTSIHLTPVQKEIALYWDDNPNIANPNGHINYFTHKISPVGHWIKITSQCCNQLQYNAIQTTQLFTLISIAMYDGIIQCWNQKYESNALRPETYINRMINPRWLPLIQTPPFPEYTSGHSVISSAAATILSTFIPQPFPFTDSTEVINGIAPRRFNSFTQAAQEAGMSRYYGGIHYIPAITEGSKQGKAVANYLLLNYKK